MKTYLKIAELYLQEGDSAQAEASLSRAAALEKDTKDATMQIKYKAAQARVWDFKRKFVEAAAKYYELSLDNLIADVEKMQDDQKDSRRPMAPHRRSQGERRMTTHGEIP